MKKVVIFLVMAALMVAAASSYAQRLGTRQQTHQARVAKKEAQRNAVKAKLLLKDLKDEPYFQVKMVQKHLNSLKRAFVRTKPDSVASLLSILEAIHKDSLAMNLLKTYDRTPDWVKADIDRWWSNADRMDRIRDSIMHAYVTNSSLPEEMTEREESRRLRSEVIKRQELTFQKIALSPVYGDKVNGFEGIIANLYIVPITFQFVPLNGGEGKSILTDAGKTVKEKLIPGNYRVHFLNGGTEICRPIDITVDAVVQQYKGEACHWFVYLPRYQY